METKTYTTEVAGKTLTAEFTDLTGQANGSVLLKMGETVVLVTAVMGRSDNKDLSFFPLSVEFEEKFYATGQILGSRFQRREGKPSDGAVLAARMVDRTIRPLFDNRIRCEIQVVVTVLALGEDDPDMLGVVGASLALGVSDIPWDGPVGAVRIGKRIDTGELVVNPTYLEREEGLLEYEVFACTKDEGVNMIETAGLEVTEATIVDALTRAVEITTALEAFQKTIIAERGKEKRPTPENEISPELQALFDAEIVPKLSAAVFCGEPGKHAIHELKRTWFELLAERLQGTHRGTADMLFEHAVDVELHRGVIEDKKRPDGRDMDTVRPLYARAGGISPALHGSGIFYRGETHMFTALTLGGPDDSQILDTIEENGVKKQFMHHYNFPPFSVGETGRVGGFNRRMIGHGALAEKAIAAIIPDKKDFPYTIRLVSETLSSNGSSSMGSVCASTLALMDGGVPIKRPAAGIASGLMMAADGRYQLLTDIQGPEDEHGDMDFKVAGTREGITAMQMDVKVGGIPVSVLGEALEKARVARLKILDVIEAEISVPRAEISPRAPKIVMLSILPTQIGLVIGGGGKTINAIKEETGVEEITIEDDGTVYITGKNGTADVAASKIKALTHVFTIGDRLEAEITRIAEFGAFARLNEYTEGLIHVSEIAPFRIEKVEDVLAVGQKVPVLVSRVEEGKIGLSIKQADPEFVKQPK